MGRRAIDPVDTIWLNMDRANNLMVIESLMMLESPMDWQRLLEVLQRRVVDVYPVFSQRAVPGHTPFVPQHWQDDDDFSLSRHVHWASLPEPGDDIALQDYVNAHISTPLKRDRPLWEIHLIDGYGGGAAVYTRLHHALADGIALTQVLLSMTDESPDEHVEATPTTGHHSRGSVAGAAHLAAAVGGALLGTPRLLTRAHLSDAVTLVGRSTEHLGKPPAEPQSGLGRLRCRGHREAGHLGSTHSVGGRRFGGTRDRHDGQRRADGGTGRCFLGLPAKP